MGRFDLKNKKVLVVGAAKTGTALAGFLTQKGAKVTVTDRAMPEDLGNIPSMLAETGVQTVFGNHDPGLFSSSDLMILSPGVDPGIVPVQKARANGVTVIGEIELAARFIRAPIVCVTGTNGKTTVTRMIAAMLEKSGKSVFVGGNIGTPLVLAAQLAKRPDIVVAEVSSFQLDTIADFSPAVAVLLNITEDHLDRYADFNAYAASKARIFENQDEGDLAVVNAADGVVRRLAKDIKAETCWFNDDSSKGCSAFVSGADVIVRNDKTGILKICCESLPLPGRHNLENVSAAALAALGAGATPTGIFDGLAGFALDPHRIEYVASVNGVACYDDSKATNVDAVIKAVCAMPGPVVLIMGGRDKGGKYERLLETVAKKVRAVVLMGEAAEKIRCAIGVGKEIVFANNMEKAVDLGLKMARPGDSLLLSPACSSFDAYVSYAARGEDFKQAVMTATKEKK